MGVVEEYKKEIMGRWGHYIASPVLIVCTWKQPDAEIMIETLLACTIAIICPLRCHIHRDNGSGNDWIQQSNEYAGEILKTQPLRAFSSPSLQLEPLVER